MSTPSFKGALIWIRVGIIDAHNPAAHFALSVLYAMNGSPQPKILARL
jgi:hypothetical protein